MRVAIAPDKFKDSLTAPEVARCLAQGFRDVSSQSFEIIEMPLADGGEGTATVLANSGEVITVETVDALNRPVLAHLVRLDQGTVVVEMAEADGLWRLKPSERNPLMTSTRGTGILMRQAIEIGAQRIVVGAGGSATVDGGLGALVALGLEATDTSGKQVEPTGENLTRIRALDCARLDHRLGFDVDLVVACDVTAPFHGASGAARQFARQKGANDDDVDLLEKGLIHLGHLYRDAFGVGVDNVIGAGAAGGLAAGLYAGFNASLVDGFDFVAERTGFDDLLVATDLVVTGEGSFDVSRGKLVGGIARHARRCGVPVVVIAGRVLLGDEVMREMGITYRISLEEMAGSLTAARTRSRYYLRMAAQHVARKCLDLGAVT